tara:strand:- start:462 stop:1730 length:1269 start_codon:yes stop_codon:yes gene_type:complete
MASKPINLKHKTCPTGKCPHWQVTISNGFRADGSRDKRKYTFIGTLREVRVLAFKKEQDLKNGIDYSDDSRRTMNDVFDRFESEYINDTFENRLSDITKAVYRRHLNKVLRPFFGNIKVKGLTIYDFELFLKHLRKQQLAPRTVKAYFIIAKMCLDHMLDWRWSNPDKLLDIIRRLNKLVRSSSQPTVRRQPVNYQDYKQISKHYKGTYLGLVLHLALYTAMRREEIMGLRWSDIDFFDTIKMNKTGVCGIIDSTHTLVYLKDDHIKELQLRDIGKTKSSKRKIAFGPLTKQLLLEYKAKQQATGNDKYKDLIAAKRSWGDCYNPISISKMINTSCNKLGLVQQVTASSGKSIMMPNISLHRLRHTSITAMSQIGMPELIKKQMIGHSIGSDVTALYTHMTINDQMPWIYKINEFLDNAINA